MWASAQTEGGEAVNMPDSDIRILYEDSEILLVQKPAGMPSQPIRAVSPTCSRCWLGERLYGWFIGWIRRPVA